MEIILYVKKYSKGMRKVDIRTALDRNLRDATKFHTIV